MPSFLDLVNLTRVEAGVAGSDLTTLQSGLSQESTRFKGWVNREWLRVQADRADWNFLRQSSQFPLTANVGSYTPAAAGAVATPVFDATTFQNWRVDSFRFSANADLSDEMLAAFIDYPTFRDLYQYGNTRTQRSRPVAFSVAPDRTLLVGNVPDQTYYVTFEYMQSPQALVADTDVPSMPYQFHELIAFRALKAYGLFMSAGEVVSRAQGEISRIYPQLLNDQLPLVLSGPPLA